jgi:succinate dehydrogenase / fumarate reductase, cytochrome b subunit
MHKRPRRFIGSNVGNKLVVGLTGLFLCSFLIVHLSLNLMLFKGDGGQSFNASAEALDASWIMHGLEIVLAAGFIAHIAYGVIVWVKAWSTRPTGYAVSRPSENSRLSSRTMYWTASIVFIFLVVHIKDFWFKTRFPVPGAEQSYFAAVQAAFSNPYYDAFYLVALILLGYHLRQGFQSAFQTFGLRPHWQKPIDIVGVFFWLVIPLGFASMPLYFLFAR